MSNQTEALINTAKDLMADNKGLLAMDVQVASATVTSLLRTVPAAVAGIAFLSGGQSPEQATSHLKAMHGPIARKLPRALTFSFGRALQQPALKLWNGQDDSVNVAQQALIDQATSNRVARQGNESR